MGGSCPDCLTSPFPTRHQLPGGEGPACWISSMQQPTTTLKPTSSLPSQSITRPATRLMPYRLSDAELTQSISSINERRRGDEKEREGGGMRKRERERWLGVREHVEQKGHDGDHHNNNPFIKRNYNNGSAH